MKKIVPTVDLQKFQARGWTLVRAIGARPKDCLIEKPDEELTEDELEQVGKFRGG